MSQPLYVTTTVSTAHYTTKYICPTEADDFTNVETDSGVSYCVHWETGEARTSLNDSPVIGINAEWEKVF